MLLGYGDREVYGDGYGSYRDGYGDQYDPAADLEDGADEASRRLGDSRVSVPRWHFGILFAFPSGFIEGFPPALSDKAFKGYDQGTY